MKSVKLGASNPPPLSPPPSFRSACMVRDYDDNFIPSVSPSRDFAFHLCNPIECLQTKEITNNRFLLHKSQLTSLACSLECELLVRWDIFFQSLCIIRSRFDVICRLRFSRTTAVKVTDVTAIAFGGLSGSFKSRFR